MSFLGGALSSRKNRRLLLGFVLLVAWGLRTLPERFAGNSSVAPGPSAESSTEAIETAFAQQRSDTWLTTRGVVERTLADDNDGSRHQRFILRVSPNLTVLVAHNIDLAERVPLQTGDTLDLFGEYEYNERGGVLHWTHHDPQGRREGGWIRHDGKSYR